MAEQGSNDRQVLGHSHPHPRQSLRRAVDIVTAGLFCTFIAATTLLAYLTPLIGDDYEGLRVLRNHPGLGSWVSFWYTQQYGRIPGIVMYYFVVQHKLLFTIMAGLTLPTIALLTLGVALGRRPTMTRRDLYAAGFLTVALWFSIPIGADINWRTGWPFAALPALLMLAVILPYRRWIGRSEPSAAPKRRVGATLGMLLLGALAADSHESVLVVLVALAAVFLWLALRQGAALAVPLHLWGGWLASESGRSCCLQRRATACACWGRATCRRHSALTCTPVSSSCPRLSSCG